MRAESLIREGNLKVALQDLREQVRKHPENSRYRIFLFQLLVVLGDWERALNQLDVISDLETQYLPMLHIYRNAIQCEAPRREVFSGRRGPLLLGEPPEWMAMFLESIRLIGETKYEPALELRKRAFEQATESSGTINGVPFKWIADADESLGPILELILNGNYYWVPFHQISSISITEPTDLRDLVWLPASLTWTNGGKAVGLIPARYVDSERSEDPAVQLGRRTEWVEPAEGVFRGVGQKMLITDQDEYPLLEVRNVEFTPL